MRALDLMKSAVGGLWRQKARTALTVLGVGVGGCALAFSLSLGIGLRALIDREFQSKPAFWVVHVRAPDVGAAVPEADIPPDQIAVDGAVSDDRRARLRSKLVEKYQAGHPRRPPVPLTRDRVAELAALPDVVAVDTWLNAHGWARLGDGKARDGMIVTGNLDRPTVRARLVNGRVPAAPDEILVSEFLLYELGVRDEAAFAAAVGTPVRVTVAGGVPKGWAVAHLFGVKAVDLTARQEDLLAKVAAALPGAVDKLDLPPAEKAVLSRMLAEAAARKADDDPAAARTPAQPVEGHYRIAGVVRGLTREELTDETRSDGWELRTGEIFLPPDAGDGLFNQIPWYRDRGYHSATVSVRPGGDLEGVVQGVERMGLDHYSALKWFKSAKREVTLIAAGLNLFALAILFIAALGITNTLVTTVIERTREIGILKALGATDRQVMGVFLAEGAVIGLLGGLLGLGMAWGLSVPGDGLVRRLIQEEAKEPLVSESVFEFPGWLVDSTVLFAVAVTTLAALYPARRAARLDPVEALRHE